LKAGRADMSEDDLVRAIRCAQADLAKYAEDAHAVIESQRAQVKILSNSAAALSHETSAEARFAAAQAANSFASRSATLQAALDEALASLRAGSKRGAMLTARADALREAAVYMKKDVAGVGRRVSGPQESVQLNSSPRPFSSPFPLGIKGCQPRRYLPRLSSVLSSFCFRWPTVAATRWRARGSTGRAPHSTRRRAPQSRPAPSWRPSANSGPCSSRSCLESRLTLTLTLT